MSGTIEVIHSSGGLHLSGEARTVLVLQSSPPRTIDVGFNPIRLITTKPLVVMGRQAQLPSTPLGDVVWGKALVYADVTDDDFDTYGNLTGSRDYIVMEHLVQTSGNSILFLGPVDDGSWAVVSYLTTAYD